MKVLHIVAGDLQGGAARGALWLHQGLLKSNIDSLLFVQKGTSNKKNIITASSIKKLKKTATISSSLDKEIVRMYKKREKTLFSPSLFGIDITKLNFYKEADIIHFHWINNGFININQFSKIQKPIVWSFRDLWPITGGCHYVNDCKKYQTGCNNCQILNTGYKFDLSWLTHKRKQKHFGNNITPVAVSNWVKNCAEKSLLFKNSNIEVINNGVDTNLFKPIDKNIARQVLDIPSNKKIILFGALNASADLRKGYKELLSALKYLNKNEYYIVVFGTDNNEPLEALGFNYKVLGHINNDLFLPLIYSSADVFITPALEEACGKSAIEAMSCGVPVVAFNCSGQTDLISHQITGYLAEPFSPKDLANGINWILADKERTQLLSTQARKTAQQNFDVEVIAQNYIKIYKKIINT